MNSNYVENDGYTYIDSEQEPGVDHDEVREFQRAYEKQSMKSFLDRMYNKRSVMYKPGRRMRSKWTLKGRR